MRKKITRTKGNRFCTLEVELSDRNGKGLELSITGMAGRVQSRAQSKRDALQTWISYFDDMPGEIINMNRRFNKRFTSSAGAARFVIATDGEFHGVDVVQEEGNKTFVVECCGQIQDEIAEFFPEAKPFFQYHMNGLNAGCKHQRALGWGNDKINAPCPECGYKYGTEWLYEPLPQSVIDWVNSL